MATFVLIHGACHAAWCWERVVPLLQDAGHNTIAPDLPGFGADTTPIAALSLDLWAEFVADVARRASEPVILVGHSRGGIVISCAAERAPASVREVVYLSAFLLPDGVTLAQAASRATTAFPEDLLRPTDDGLGMTINPAYLSHNFYNTTAPEWVARARTRMQPEPIMSWSSRVHVSEDNFGRIPRVYIECLQDRALTLELQRSMQKDLPCHRRFTLDTDHSPFYSSPHALVEILCTIARA
jgi:pimeloyl-ACP methyl ester carboxylesterase